VGARVLRGEQPEQAARALSPDDLADPRSLRTAEIANAASRVAALPEVRAALVDFQRVFAARSGGAVLDGRDIGTVICPDAPAKLFITARPEVRARRRLAEFHENGVTADYDTVLAEVRARDARDAERSVAPMKPAQDAITIDTSEMSIPIAIETAVSHIRATQR